MKIFRGNVIRAKKMINETNNGWMNEWMNKWMNTNKQKTNRLSKHYFGVDFFSRTHLLSDFEFSHENVGKLVRTKISTNKVFHSARFHNSDIKIFFNHGEWGSEKYQWIWLILCDFLTRNFKIFFNHGEVSSEKYYLNYFVLVGFRISDFKFFFNHGEWGSEKN